MHTFDLHSLTPPASLRPLKRNINTFTYREYYLGTQDVFKIWCSYHIFCIFNVCVTANIFIFVDTKRNFRDLWEEVRPKDEIIPENEYIYGMEFTKEHRHIEDDLVINDF